MKLIERLSDFIEDEIDGARCYAKMALEYKESKPELARIMSNLSAAELQHVSDIHAIVLEEIDAYRREHGEPPVDMLAIYNYIHEKHVNKVADVRVMLNTYKLG